MNPANRKVLALLALALSMAWSTTHIRAETATELIVRAHQYDNMYTLSPEASQQKALGLYESALKAEPDDQQRLHILFRMAQLNGSAYQLEKGEKPDFRKAITLYEKIIDTYPPDEPLVHRAKIAIADHYVSLWEFERAIAGFKEILKYDVSDLKTRAQSLEQQGQRKEAEALRRIGEQIEGYQKVAVDQVNYSAGLIDPLRAHGELRKIADDYAGTFIGDRAAERLRENMDQFSDLWRPEADGTPTSGSELRADGGPTAGLSNGPNGLEPQPDKIDAAAEADQSAEADDTNRTQQVEHVAQPRGPPFGWIAGCVGIAAGLVGVGLAATILTRNRPIRKE
jgi:tetratricopeptide (TPR) repeat protein